MAQVMLVLIQGKRTFVLDNYTDTSRISSKKLHAFIKKLAKAALGAARYGKTWLGHGQDRASP